jgi:hypothetical protein
MGTLVHDRIVRSTEFWRLLPVDDSEMSCGVFDFKPSISGQNWELAPFPHRSHAAGCRVIERNHYG